MGMSMRGHEHAWAWARKCSCGHMHVPHANSQFVCMLCLVAIVTPLSFAHLTHLSFRTLIRLLASHAGTTPAHYLAHHTVARIISCSYAGMARVVMSFMTCVPGIASVARLCERALCEWYVKHTRMMCSLSVLVLVLVLVSSLMPLLSMRV